MKAYFKEVRGYTLIAQVEIYFNFTHALSLLCHTSTRLNTVSKYVQIEAKIREAESENDTESENDDSDNGDDDNASSYTYASDNEDKEIKLKITNIISEWNDDSRSNQ